MNFRYPSTWNVNRDKTVVVAKVVVLGREKESGRDKQNHASYKPPRISLVSKQREITPVNTGFI